jgi:hypothetical protein
MDLEAIVKEITEANGPFERAVKTDHCRELFPTTACKLCREYLREREADTVDEAHLDEQQEMYRAVQLLLILTALQLGKDEALEALRCMGTYGVDARKPRAWERFSVAGRDRPRRPVKDPGSYRKHHLLPHVQPNLTESLHLLTRERNGATCNQALADYGEQAVTKYLGKLQ